MVKVSASYNAWNVSALFDNMEGARRAIDACQNDGVEAGTISLSGEGAGPTPLQATMVHDVSGRLRVPSDSHPGTAVPLFVRLRASEIVCRGGDRSCAHAIVVPVGGI